MEPGPKQTSQACGTWSKANTPSSIGNLVKSEHPQKHVVPDPKQRLQATCREPDPKHTYQQHVKPGPKQTSQQQAGASPKQTSQQHMERGPKHISQQHMERGPKQTSQQHMERSKANIPATYGKVLSKYPSNIWKEVQSKHPLQQVESSQK